MLKQRHKPSFQFPIYAFVLSVFDALLFVIAGCNPRPTTVPTQNVHPDLKTVSKMSAIVISDTLESLIADGKDTKEDREFAYHTVVQRSVQTVEDAYARADVAGRLAEISGMSAGPLVPEIEQYARLSLEKARDFRNGAAQRMLGTLYVLAPAMMLRHGDSEQGLEMLQQLTEKWPTDVENHLRLAEAYIALGDEKPVSSYLCFCVAHKTELRRDDQKLLEKLIEDVDLGSCPK
jgi:hypothetical protein